MGRIALKVDVDTLRGTQEGVPRLLELFSKYRLHATFLFSLGPDHTGWALKQIFKPGFFQKVSRTSVVEHYGIKTLLYGTLLPAPDIGIRARKEMQSVEKLGHEVGIHTWDHRVWQDKIAAADPSWTQGEMQKAFARYQTIFTSPLSTFGAAGWQMNEAALRQLDAWGVHYSSDGRANLNLVPYRIQYQDGSVSKHIQYPTTLPTFDELLGVDEMQGLDCVNHLLSMTSNNPNDQVFTLHAELEGNKLLPYFESLIQGWFNQGHQLTTMAELHSSWRSTGQLGHLAILPLMVGQVPNRSGELMIMPELKQ